MKPEITYYRLPHHEDPVNKAQMATDMLAMYASQARELIAELDTLRESITFQHRFWLQCTIDNNSYWQTVAARRVLSMCRRYQRIFRKLSGTCSTFIADEVSPLNKWTSFNRMTKAIDKGFRQYPPTKDERAAMARRKRKKAAAAPPQVA